MQKRKKLTTDSEKIDNYYSKGGTYRWAGTKDQCITAIVASNKCAKKKDFLFSLYMQDFSVELLDKFNDWPYPVIILSLLFFYTEKKDRSSLNAVDWTHIFSLIFQKTISSTVYQFIEYKELLIIPTETNSKDNILVGLQNAFLPFHIFSNTKIDDLCLINLLKLFKVESEKIDLLVKQNSSNTNLNYLFNFLDQQLEVITN